MKPMNKTDSNFLIFEGRTKRIPDFLYILISILSLGTIPIIFKHFPKLKILILTKKSPFSESQYIKVTNHQQETTLEDVKCLDISDSKMIRSIKNIKRYFKNRKLLYVETHMIRFIFDPVFNKYVIPKVDRLEVIEKYIIYGNNSTQAKIPSDIGIIIDAITDPIVLYVLTSIIVFYFIDYAIYATITLIMLIFSLIFHIYKDFANKHNLKKISKRVDDVNVFRSGWQKINSKKIYPGDIILLETGKEVYCDVELIYGESIVNESFLTGESTPVFKKSSYEISETGEFIKKNYEDNKTCIYAGTVILSAQNKDIAKFRKHNFSYSYSEDDVNLALILKSLNLNIADVKSTAIARVKTTGFNTLKGSFIRDVLITKPQTYEFYEESRKMNITMICIGTFLVTFLIVLFALRGKTVHDSVLIGWDLFCTIFPPTLPVAIRIGLDISYKELKDRKVNCNHIGRINSIGMIDLCVFDKTGTLTEGGLDVLKIDSLDPDVDKKINNVYCRPESNSFMATPSNSHENDEERKLVLEDDKNKKICSRKLNMTEINEKIGLIRMAISTCHNIVRINDDSLGDILDLKMFEYSKSKFIAQNVIEDDCFTYNIEEVCEFSSKSRKMSVVVKFKNKRYFFVKGSAESVQNMIQNIPKNYEENLKVYSNEGRRVIMIAGREINDNLNIDQLQKKNDLQFLGLIVFENKLKPQSKHIINDLKRADIDVMMCTGDSLLTAICVAKKCNIMQNYKPTLYPVINKNVSSAYDIEWAFIGGEEDVNYTFDKFTLNLYKDDVVEEDFQLAIEGNAFSFFKEFSEHHYDFILDNTTVFARMDPTQKRILIEDLNKDYHTCFCGDGANDCGALKSAEIGISLSENESAIFAPFVSSVLDISSVKSVLLVGRSALVTSYCSFVNVIMCAAFQFLTLSFLCISQRFLTEGQTIYQDIGIIYPYALLLSTFKPSTELVVEKPQSRLFIPKFLTLILGHTGIAIIYSIITFISIDKRTNSPIKTDTREFPKDCPLSIAMFFLCAIQCFVINWLNTKGRPHRENKYKKTIFVGFSAFTFFFIIFLLIILFFFETVELTPLGIISDSFGFFKIDNTEKIKIVIILSTYTATALIFDCLIYRKIVKKINDRQKQIVHEDDF